MSEQLKDIILDKGGKVAGEYLSEGLGILRVFKWMMIIVTSSIVLGVVYAIFG